MTKKELLELEAFKNMPDDTEIVFHTSNIVEQCVPLESRNCYYISQCVNSEYISRCPEWTHPEPKYHAAFVIDAMPLDYMERKYNMTFKFE